jgi:hypothetical protein
MVVEHINKELEKVLNKILKNQLDDLLHGIPVTGLIGKTRAAESYR